MIEIDGTWHMVKFFVAIVIVAPLVLVGPTWVVAMPGAGVEDPPLASLGLELYSELLAHLKPDESHITFGDFTRELLKGVAICHDDKYYS